MSLLPCLFLLTFFVVSSHVVAEPRDSQWLVEHEFSAEDLAGTYSESGFGSVPLNVTLPDGDFLLRGSLKSKRHFEGEVIDFKGELVLKGRRSGQELTFAPEYHWLERSDGLSMLGVHSPLHYNEVKLNISNNKLIKLKNELGSRDDPIFNNIVTTIERWEIVTSPDCTIDQNDSLIVRQESDPNVDTDGADLIDEMRAFLEEGFRQMIPSMSTDELVDRARWLNDMLLSHDEDVGPKEKSAIAETLIKMHSELSEKRLPGEKVGLAELDGVTWQSDDPTAGIVENIPPFGMVDWWYGFVLPRDRQPTQQSTKESVLGEYKNGEGKQEPSITPRENSSSQNAKLHELWELPDDFPNKAGLEIGDHPRDRPWIRDARLFVPDPKSGHVQWINVQDIPQGYGVYNDHWIVRRGQSVESAQRYPEGQELIQRNWMHRNNRPLVDMHGCQVEMDSRQLQRLRETHRLLNQWMESHLKRGSTLEQAERKVRRDALLMFKIEIVNLLKLAI